MSSDFKSENVPEDAYTEFLADKDHVIRTGINSTLDSPIKMLEEHIDNCKDAKATNVTVGISLIEGNTGFLVEDDGRGIKHPHEVVTFGSGHKEEEARQDPTVDYSGRFGEGAKSTLRIADTMDYYSNNGTENDIYIRIRSPNKFSIKQAVYIDDKRLGGSCKPTVGTRMVAHPVDKRHLQSMIHEIADHTAAKFAWLLATKEFRITVRIIDENGKGRPPFILSVPPRLSNLFGDYPDKKVVVGYVTDAFEKEFQIEGLFSSAEKKSDRKIYFACHRRIIKAVPTEYNVQAIVNCDGLQVTKDRTGFDSETELARILHRKVNSYVAKNYQKASLFENMSNADKEAHFKVLAELNKIAEESGILGKPMPQLKEKHKGIASVDPDNEQMDQYLRTSRKTSSGMKIDDSIAVWQKIKGEVDKGNKNEIIGGAPPEDGGEAGGTNNVNPELKKREVLVQKVVSDQNNKRSRTHYAIHAQVEQIGRNKSISPGFFSIGTDEVDEDIALLTRKDEQAGWIFINLNFNFYKLNRPPTYPKPEWDIKAILPLVAEGATEILFGAQGSQTDYRTQYDRILHRISGVFL